MFVVERGNMVSVDYSSSLVRKPSLVATLSIETSHALQSTDTVTHC